MQKFCNTPVKVFKQRPNDFCRICRESIKISGRSQINIFGENNREFLRRFETVTDTKALDVDGLSQVLCQKCYRTVLKYHKILDQEKDILTFRQAYNGTIICLDLVRDTLREKRRAKDSPTTADVDPQRLNDGRVRKKACAGDGNLKSRRKLLSDNRDSVLEDYPFQDLDTGVLLDSRDRKSKFNARTEVHIDYPSGRVKKVIQQELDGTIVRQVAHQEYRGVANSLWKHPSLKDEILQKVYSDIDKESSSLCSDKHPSVLKKTNAKDLVEFSERKCEEELATRAPTLYGCMCSSVASLRRRRKRKEENSDKMSGSTAPIAFAASILLKQRCPQMSALAYRFSLGVLWHSGAKKQGFVRANRWGISVSHNSTLKKLDEMGESFDLKVKMWKSELEKHHLVNEMLDHVDEHLAAQEAQKQEQIPEGFQTINISSLDLSFPTADSSMECCNDKDSQSTNSDLPNMEDFLEDYLQYCQSESTKALSNAESCPVSDHLINCGFSEDDLKTFKDFVFDKETVDELNKLDKIDVGILKSIQNSSQPPKYQIIGDNLDMYVKVKHMSSDKQNKSIHWFAMNAIQDRVSLECPKSTRQIKPILEVENSEFLPSPEDNNKLLQDFIPLAARVLVDKVPDFKCFKGAIIKHIPHRYSHEMKKKSVQVPLGMLFKNENLNDEMIEILEHIQSQYVPTQVMTTECGDQESEVIESIFFGGDQLTEERGRNAKDARGDGDTNYDRLEGVETKHEDWHAIRLIYQILYDILYKASSSSDQGTMCSNINVTNNVNAKTNNVEDNFNYCKDFVETETNAYIVAATMSHFSMNSLDDEVVPHSVRTASVKEKQLWFYNHVKTILEKYVMKKQSEEYSKIVDHVNTLNQPKQRTVYPCSECGKTYVYKKARDSHLQLKHGVDIAEPISEAIAETPKQLEVKEDYVYNYACVRLSLGMLIFNFNDAVKEGDGARIVRCWKYMLLLFKGHGHTKYALASLHLLANTQALLSPEKAHSLIWNRTVNNKGGAGNNISMDLRMEHIIHLHKEMLSNLGANLHQPPALRCSRAVKPVEDLLSSIDAELTVRRPSGKHTVTRSQSDFHTIVHELHTRAEVFVDKSEEGRQHAAFPKFKRSVLSTLEYDKLNSWITQHKKKWAKQGF